MLKTKPSTNVVFIAHVADGTADPPHGGDEEEEPEAGGEGEGEVT